uniref:Uncharacterized protein n=1 Tax=Glossina brevipalpis TaxID=37001 RepID=A0A1A9W2Y7_9MUSC
MCILNQNSYSRQRWFQIDILVLFLFNCVASKTTLYASWLFLSEVPVDGELFELLTWSPQTIQQTLHHQQQSLTQREVTVSDEQSANSCLI